MHKPTTREEHPLPAVLMHYGHLISMIVLIITGLYIHSPFSWGSMEVMRNLHFIFMSILICVAVIRIYWAFMGGGSAAPGERKKISDWRHFFPQKENRGKFIPIIMYYLFLRRTHPVTGKYNTLQKGTYIFWVLLIVIQAITGFALWTPTAGVFASLTYALGGTMMIRIIHYWIMWVFIATTMIHIYLSAAEVWPEIPLMFFWREQASSKKRTESTAGGKESASAQT